VAECSIDISIVLVTYNGELYLAEVLTSIFSQKTSFSYEVIAIDSGSSDHTVDIIKQFPVRLFQISKQDFGHGRTRNYGASHAFGQFIVFLTQDATPANEYWLNNLVEPLVDNLKTAGVYSRQIARQDCNPCELRDICIGAGPISKVKRVNFHDPLQVEAYKKDTFLFIAFSNVSSCIRKKILEDLPFSEHILMMEDQEWCKRAINSGSCIIYEATSIVYHSHNHSLSNVYQRHYDYGISLQAFTDFSISTYDVLSYTIMEALADILFIFRQGYGVTSLFKWALKSPFVRFMMRYGLYKGMHFNSSTLRREANQK
jgi:rhamnosyltransferase